MNKVEGKGKKPLKKKPRAIYTYKVETGDGKVMKGLSRNELAPFYLTDQFMMKDIHRAHKAMKEISDEIKEVMAGHRKAFG